MSSSKVDSADRVGVGVTNGFSVKRPRSPVGVLSLEYFALYLPVEV